MQYTIQKKQDVYILHVKTNTYRTELYKFFIESNILSLAFVDLETNELYFHANTVCSLDVFFKNQHFKLTEKQALCIIQSISYQIEWFEKKNLTFLGWNMHDIIVINNFYFFIATNSFIQPIRFDKIELFVPYEKPYFSSPEIVNVNKLPSYIHFKSCYYSLGLFIVFGLLNQFLLKGNDIPSQEHIKDVLKPFRFTKIYWFLLRCLQDEPEQRILLYT